MGDQSVSYPARPPTSSVPWPLEMKTPRDRIMLNLWALVRWRMRWLQLHCECQMISLMILDGWNGIVIAPPILTNRLLAYLHWLVVLFDFDWLEEAVWSTKSNRTPGTYVTIVFLFHIQIQIYFTFNHIWLCACVSNATDTCVRCVEGWRLKDGGVWGDRMWGMWGRSPPHSWKTNSSGAGV